MYAKNWTLWLLTFSNSWTKPNRSMKEKAIISKLKRVKKKKKWENKIQFRVSSAEIIHVLVRGTEVVDVGFSEGRTRELHVGPCAVWGDVEAFLLEEEVGFHAPVLVRRTNHGVSVIPLHCFFFLLLLLRWFLGWD